MSKRDTEKLPTVQTEHSWEDIILDFNQVVKTLLSPGDFVNTYHWDLGVRLT